MTPPSPKADIIFETNKQRTYFKIDLVHLEFNQNHCKTVIKELKEIPSLSLIKETDQRYLLYMRGFCFFQQKQWQPARSDFKTALKDLDPKLMDLREDMVLKLAEIHRKAENYSKVAESYEYFLLPYLKDKKKRQKYSFYLGQIYHHPLNKLKSSRKWLKQVDQGGTSDIELESLFILSQIEAKEDRLTQAIQNLHPVTKNRPLKKTSWFIPFHYQLAILLGQKNEWKHALRHYEELVSHPKSKIKEHTNLQKESNTQIKKIKAFLAHKQLNELVAKGSWKKVSQFIHSNLSKGKLPHSIETIETLIHAETEHKNWEGVLQAYEMIGKINPSKAITIDAYLARGQASEFLKKDKEAKEFYEIALRKAKDLSTKTPDKEDMNVRAYLIERLGTLMGNKSQYAPLVQFYKSNYPELNKKEHQVHFAFLIGFYSLYELKLTEQAKLWFEKADQGGITDEELNARFLISEIETQAKQPKKAFQTLKNLALRPIGSQSPWYLMTHYQLGSIYHAREDWEQALLHYNQAASSKSISGYEEYQESAKKLALEIKQYLQSVKTSP